MIKVSIYEMDASRRANSWLWPTWKRSRPRAQPQAAFTLQGAHHLMDRKLEIGRRNLLRLLGPHFSLSHSLSDSRSLAHSLSLSHTQALARALAHAPGTPSVSGCGQRPRRHAQMHAALPPPPRELSSLLVSHKAPICTPRRCANGRQSLSACWADDTSGRCPPRFSLPSRRVRPLLTRRRAVRLACWRPAAALFSSVA